MPKFSSSEKKILRNSERYIKERGLKGAEARGVRTATRERIRRENEARVQQLLKARVDARKAHPTLASIGDFSTRPLGAAAAGVAGSQTLGQIGNAAALAQVPVTALRQGVNPVEAFRINQREGQANTEAIRRGSPISSATGKVAGFFTPGGAPSLLARGAARTLQTAGPLARLAIRSAGKGFGERAAAQTVSNLAGSGAVLTGINLLEAGDETLAERIANTASEFKSPTNLILNTMFGSAQGAFRTVATRQGQAAVGATTRQGISPTPDIARVGTSAGRGLNETLGAAGALPFGQSIRQNVMGLAMRQLERTTREIRRRLTRDSQRNTKAVAGGAVGDIQGRVERLRQGINNKAFKAEGANQIGRTSQNAFLTSMDSFLRQTVGKGEQMSTPLRAWVSNVRRTMVRNMKEGETIDIQTVDNLRQGLRNVAKSAEASDLDRRLLNHMTDTIHGIYQLKAPQVESAMIAGQFLRRVQEQLPSAVRKVALDSDEKITELLAAKNFQTRFDAFLRFSTQAEQQALKGEYLGRLINKITLNTSEGGLISLGSLNRAMKRPGGEFSADKVRRILGGGVLKELRRKGRVGDALLSGIGRPRGSETGARLAQATVFAGIAFGPLAVMQLLRSDEARENITLATLGNAGLFTLINSVARGRTGQGLNRLALGQGQPGPNLLSGAVQNIGPETQESLSTGAGQSRSLVRGREEQ